MAYAAESIFAFPDGKQRRTLRFPGFLPPGTTAASGAVSDNYITHFFTKIPELTASALLQALRPYTSEHSIRTYVSLPFNSTSAYSRPSSSVLHITVSPAFIGPPAMKLTRYTGLHLTQTRRPSTPQS